MYQHDPETGQDRFASLFFFSSLFLIAWSCCVPVRAAELNPSYVCSLTYERPVPVKIGNSEIDLGQHVATRCYDWDRDGDADLLVGAGDGRLWLYRNAGGAGTFAFESEEAITAGAQSRWGTGYTGLAFVNLMGNSLPDLVVCHSGQTISVHPNVGTYETPAFAETGLSFEVQKSCEGRFDIADWDGDGLLDLITGSFGGELVWYRNEGSLEIPQFGTGQPFHGIRMAYNAHPRIMDINRDGRKDLILGVNWGTVSLFLHPDDETIPLQNSHSFQWLDGNRLNIREQNGDDTTPELVDLDGDGVQDLISGGKNGKVFFMRGIGYSERLETFQQILAVHADDLGNVLKNQARVRERIFGALVSLQSDLSTGIIPAVSREALFTQLAGLADSYPELLGRKKYDLEASPHLPLLAGQFWTVVLETLPDSPENRKRVASVLNFQGGYRKLLLDLGVLLIDNDTATPEHLDAMHRLMLAMPGSVWDVETITVAGWLGSAAKTQKIRSRSGINIFDLPLGRPENSFPNDSPRAGVTDVYLICLAHELAHNMLDTVGRREYPELYQRKFLCLSQAAGPDVVFHSPPADGIDFEATKANFKNRGVWDGNETSWDESWVAYFQGKEQYDRAYTRGNVHFFLNAPQEAFATLANQYFADSQLMLEFCDRRWNDGYRSNINQFLLIADYLSAGSNEVAFYVMRPGGDLEVTSVQLQRDQQRRIIRLKSSEIEAHFGYENGPLVTDLNVQAL